MSQCESTCCNPFPVLQANQLGCVSKCCPSALWLHVVEVGHSRLQDYNSLYSLPPVKQVTPRTLSQIQNTYTQKLQSLEHIVFLYQVVNTLISLLKLVILTWGLTVWSCKLLLLDESWNALKAVLCFSNTLKPVFISSLFIACPPRVNVYVYVTGSLRHVSDVSSWITCVLRWWRTTWIQHGGRFESRCSPSVEETWRS